MYILQEKPDQHATRIPHSVHVWFQTIRISHGQRIATFRVVPTRSKQALHLEEILATKNKLAQPSFWVTVIAIIWLDYKVGCEQDGLKR
jgi:hypothetical protein